VIGVLAACDSHAREFLFSQKITIPTSLPGDNFGFDCGISGSTLIVGAPFTDVAGRADQGVAYVFERTEGQFVLRQTLTASPSGQANDIFGAVLEVSGTLAAISLVGRGNSTGAVQVFSRNGGAEQPWEFRRQLDPEQPIATPGARFGIGLDLEQNIIMVGASATDVPGLPLSGEVLFYKPVGQNWAPAQALSTGVTGRPLRAGDGFGQSISLDFDSVAIGAFTTSTRDANGVVELQRRGAAHVFSLDNQWRYQSLIEPQVGAGGLDFFGETIALSGDRLLVAAGDADVAGVIDRGAVYAFERTGPAINPVWSPNTATPQLLQGPATPSARAGVAAVFGDVAVLGSLMDGNGSVGSGLATIFRRSVNGGWISSQTIRIPDAAPNDLTLPICAQSAVVVLGAREKDSGRGAAYVYVESGTDAAPQSATTLTDANGAADERAGSAVSAQGDLVVVGVPGGIDGGSKLGEVQVFQRLELPVTSAKGASLGSSLALVARLLPPTDAAVGTKFSSSVDVSHDGSRIVVGEPGFGPGRVWVFAANPATGWRGSAPGTVNLIRASVQSPVVQLLQPPSATVAVSPSGFGTAIDITESGRLIVGAPDTDLSAAADAGAAYVYDPVAAFYPSAPSEQFVDGSPGIGDKFGSAVGGAGDLVAIGAPASSTPGHVSVFQDPSTAPSQPTTTLLLSGGVVGDAFGTALAISDERLVIGAPGRDAAGSGGTDSGEAYLYQINQLSVEPVPTVLVTAGSGSADAGYAVALSEDGLVLVGARNDDSNGAADSGVVHLFDDSFSVAEMAKAMTPNQVVRPGILEVGQQFGSAVAISRSSLYVGVPARDVVAVTGSAATASVEVRTDQGAVESFEYRAELVFRSDFE
jgi:hypothetical protein